MLDDFTSLTVLPDASVRECIALISENGRRIALVVTVDGLLAGVVTDSDIRRGVLRGVDLEGPVSEIMNPTPIVASPTEHRDAVLARITANSIHHIPIVDGGGRVTGLITLEDLLETRSAVSTPVVLMAGGRGQRLLPLTRDVPKPMLPVGGVPLIEIILRRLASQGLRRVHVSVNYLADVIIDYIGDGSRFGVSVEYLHESKPLGTAGALAGLVDRVDEPFIVMNSDLLTHVDLLGMIAFHRNNGGAATVGVREHMFEIPYGVVDVDGAAVRAITEKPQHRSLVNAGVYVLDPGTLRLLEREEYKDMPTLLDEVMASGQTVAAFPIHERWIDVGRPEDLEYVRSSSDDWTTT